jgi:hypothetical protein
MVALVDNIKRPGATKRDSTLAGDPGPAHGGTGSMNGSDGTAPAHTRGDDHDERLRALQAKLDVIIDRVRHAHAIRPDQGFGELLDALRDGRD